MSAGRNLIEVLFKNGERITFHCSNFKVQTLDGEITGYSYEGVPYAEKPLYMRIDDIVSVQDVSYREKVKCDENSKEAFPEAGEKCS